MKYGILNWWWGETDHTQDEIREHIPNEIPKKCCCGKDFSVSHSLTCKKGGFVHMRHDAVRDTFADLIEEFGKDISEVIDIDSLEEIGSGSIGQVYRGKMIDGSDVNFKNLPTSSAGASTGSLLTKIPNFTKLPSL